MDGTLIRKRRGGVILTAFLMMMVLVLAACGSDSKSSDSTTTASGGSSSDFVAQAKQKVKDLEGDQSFPALPSSPAPKANQSIFIIEVDSSLEGVVRQGDGVRSAVDALGWKQTTVDGKSSPDAMAAGVERAVAEKANAIIMVTANSTYIQPAIDKAKAANIPVVTMTSGSPTTGPDAITAEIVTVAYNKAMGETQGYFVVADSDGKANALVFNDTSFTTAPPISQGAYDIIKQCTTCKVQPQIDFVSTDLATKFSEQVRTALTNNPDVNYVVVPYDAAATFAVQGVRDAGKADSVQVVSTGGNLSNLDLIAQGDIQTQTSAEPLEYFGWLSVDAVVRAQGGAAQIPFQAPVKILVKSNLPPSGQPWSGDSDFEAAFLKNWGK